MAVIRLFLFVVLAISATFTAAAEQAGKVLFARGVVSIIDEQDSRRGARAGAPVYEGERIVTGANGIAQIYLSDGSLLGLRADTDYRIARQRYDEEAGIGEQAGELFSGWMRYITGAIGKRNPNNVSFSTSVATIGIRGTVFQLLHVPAEGLSEFGDAAPGSYLYLEDGQLDMQSAAGTRRLGNGDVAWVALDGAAPVPAPERRQLFQRQHLLAAAQSARASNRLTTARLLKLREELAVAGALEPILAEQLADSLFVQVGGLSLFAPEGSFSSFAAGGENLKYVDLFGERLVTGARGDSAIGDGSQDALIIRQGARPVAVGSAVLGGISQVHWGIWRAGDYLAGNTFNGPYSSSADWHYVMGSFAVADPQVLASRLDGTFNYRYVGGTPLGKASTGILPGDSTSFATVQGGQLQVDFGGNSLNANIGLSLPGTGNVAVSGGGTIGQFYTGGVGLADGTATVNGNIQGLFTGPAAEGAISTLTVNDINTNSSYGGVAVFEKREPVAVLP